MNAFWTRICQLLGINQRLSTAYHPETDGATERRNQEVETYLRAFVAYNQSDWDKWIPLAQIALDNKTATSTGISPFFLLHGWHATLITTVGGIADEDRSNTLNPRQKGEAIVAKLQEAQDFAQSAMAVA